MRLKRGFSQEDLARLADVSWITVSRWERGKSEPSLATLRKVAAIFSVDPSELLEEDKAA
jgi:transcriptional regulator with XRE-family HTH domain